MNLPRRVTGGAFFNIRSGKHQIWFSLYDVTFWDSAVREKYICQCSTDKYLR